MSDANPATAFNPFGDRSNTNPATLDLIRATQINDSATDVWGLNAIAQGPFMRLPAGPARLAIGADFRREALDSSRSGADLERDVGALFGELSLPLLSGAGSERGRPLLEASLAARYEDYSDFGTTLNPKVGVRLTPNEMVSLRASWGTSFRAPKLIDLDPTAGGQGVIVFPFPDPSAPGGLSFTLLRTGNNPDLDEETSTFWSTGFDLDLDRLVPRLTASATYYNIEYEDRVVQPGPTPIFFILQQADIWSDVITRNPSAAETAPLCAIVVSGNCALTPPTVIVDGRIRNLSAVTTSGIDVLVNQSTSTAVGEFTLSFNANYILDFEQQATPTSPQISVLNLPSNPIDFRFRLGAGWRLDGWGADVAVNYADSYADSGAPTARDVDAWTTWDLGLSYRFGGADAAAGTEIALNVNNAFDEDPPFLNTSSGFDPTNASPLGRVVSLELRRHW